MAIYGQVVVGPPGSGKTTYCNGMQQYLRLLGRTCYVVNLDPANERDHTKADEKLPYVTLLDMSTDIISLSHVMTQLHLGPNGGLLYCMEYLQKHTDDVLELLRSRLDELDDPRPYLLLDLPGQVELYTHCDCVQTVLHDLTKRFDCRLVGVQLLDGHFCQTGVEKYIAGALWCMSSMIRLDVPTVNVLSKIDLLEGDDMPFRLEYFTECEDLSRLTPFLDCPPGRIDGEEDVADDEEYRRARIRTRSTPFHKKYLKLHRAISEVIDDYSLVKFLTLNINDAKSVGRVLARIDKANGYVFTKSDKESEAQNMFQCAVKEDAEWQYEALADVEERLIGGAYKDSTPESRESQRRDQEEKGK